ncbi:beta-lactamase family protein [Flavisolibacter sp. BT320]|nr:beta-lactamase family protein [Flavisolibacter longurius]
MRKFFLPLLVITQLSFGQSANQKKMDAYCTAQASFYQFSGVVLVAKGPTVVYQKAFGTADRRWNIPTAPDTRFKIGSLTKQFTAALILQLADAGRLSLEDRLSQWFPALPKADSITLRTMLNHTSGLGSINEGSPQFLALVGRAVPPDSVITLFQHNVLRFSPGRDFWYSNPAYVLLGSIAEKVTGQPFHVAVTNMVQRLGLNRTMPDRSDTLLPQLATGYERRAGRWMPALPYAPEVLFSAGNMVSTAADLHRWQQALHGGKVVSADRYRQMITPGLGKYGFGFWIDSVHGQKLIYHTGSYPGFANYALYFPQSDLHVIVLSNGGGASPFVNMAYALAGIYLNQPVELPKKYTAIPTTATGLEAVVGRYEVGLRPFVLLVKDGRLWTQTGSRLTEWKQFATDAFFLDEGPDTQLYVLRNDSGEAKGLRLVRNGMETGMKKL